MARIENNERLLTALPNIRIAHQRGAARISLSDRFASAQSAADTSLWRKKRIYRRDLITVFEGAKFSSFFVNHIFQSLNVGAADEESRWPM